jgi:predicted nucleotidyltransferase
MPQAIYPPPDKRLDTFVRVYLPRLCAEYEPEQVWLWGSMAMGTGDEWSDIDLVIVSPKFQGTDFTQRRIELKKRLGLRLNPEVGTIDAICYTPDEFERQLSRPTIIREGVQRGRRLV